MPKIKTVKDESIEQPVDQIEVELNDSYKSHTGIIFYGHILEFVDGKTNVSKETADKLRKQGFIK